MEQLYDLEIVGADPEFGKADYREYRLDDIFDLIEAHPYELEYSITLSRP